MKKGRKIITVIAHVTAWIVFFLLPFIFSPRPKEFNFDNGLLITHVLCNNIYLIFFFYLNTYFLIPKLLNGKYWFWYVLSCIVFLVGYVYVPKEIAEFINGTKDVFPVQHLPGENKYAPHQPPPDNSKRFILFSGRTALFFFVYLVSTSLTLAQNWLSAERKTEEIEHEKINTELSFLKSQINPHFFFNTLNNIYALAVTNSNQTAAAVMKLSSIMRYVISETENEVELKSEIEFIQNYIDLQLYRLTDKVNVDFKHEGNIEGKMIVPLLFMPFVENAFKYGVSTKQKAAINILLNTVENNVNFKVVNTIFKHQEGLAEANGIGIQNVKRRLELVYPHRHTLQVFESNNQFNIELNIHLK